MEFRPGSPERRENRRICRKCRRLCGTREKCAKCGGKTAARIQICWYIDGRRRRELTACWRESDALEVLRRKEADYWRRQDLGVDREVGGSLREAVEAFTVGQAGRSGSYRKQIRTALHALADGVGWDCPVQGVAVRDIRQFCADGLDVLAPTTVRSYMLVLRRFFGYLLDDGWIRRNPTVKVPLPKAVGRRDHLRPEEVGPVLDAFWQISPSVAPIATTLALGGWRKGEIINLRHPDVYLDERWAYVLDFDGDELTEAWSPKTESSTRAVPLHPLVVSALERTERVKRPDGSLSPWVFPITDPRKRRRYRDKRGRMQPVCGDRRSPNTNFVGAKLREALSAAGIDRAVTVHGLRRTFAVLLQEVGAPDSVIRQALGHSQRGVTEISYLPRRSELVQRWVDKIDVQVSALESQSVPGRPESDGTSAPCLRVVK